MMKTRYRATRFLGAALLFLAAHAGAQPKTDTLLKQLLLRDPDPVLQQVLAHAGVYRFQIIYTQINAGRRGRPSFKNYYYHVDRQLYFNPASMVKMPLAFLSLEKLEGLRRHGIGKYTPMLIDSTGPGRHPETRDSTSASGYPSIAQYIKRAFLVSDNDAYNRMYAFVGQQTINEELHRKGYRDVRIIRQFLPLTLEQNRHTPAVLFTDDSGRLLYRQPPAWNRDSFDFSHRVFLGKGHWDSHDSLIHTPMDFTRQNNISLEDLQQKLQTVLFPRSVPRRRRFRLTPDDYRFLYRYLSQYPSETRYPKYDSALYDDSYVKFFFHGEKIPPYLRIFNKVGWSYGFLTDVSFIADFKHRVAFMLSCVVYVNSDGILNDNHYDYDTVGYPFFRAVGRDIYRYELSRPRKHPLRLDRMSIRYGHRDPRDKRPLVKAIAN
jgi:hypothetical protein